MLTKNYKNKKDIFLKKYVFLNKREKKYNINISQIKRLYFTLNSNHYSLNFKKPHQSFSHSFIF